MFNSTADWLTTQRQIDLTSTSQILRCQKNPKQVSKLIKAVCQSWQLLAPMFERKISGALILKMFYSVYWPFQRDGLHYAACVQRISNFFKFSSAKKY